MIFENKNILVTGGTGSIGKVCVHRLLTCEAGVPKKIIVLSRDESKQYSMKMDYLNMHNDIIYNNFLNLIEFRLGDICNYSSISSAIKDVDIILNIAAMKQVPICEYFPIQALETNCIGMVNIIRAIEEKNYNVEAVLAVSTDKACNPASVMGMTKSIQERIITSANLFNSKTRFICVRFGNMLSSNGSVVPLFQKQIKDGGPITITNPTMTRFFLSIDQAVDTICTAVIEASPGEIYIPNSPSASIENIAKALIGNRKINIKIVGSRPGEKTHEVLFSSEEAINCVKRGEHYVVLPKLFNIHKKQEHDIYIKEFTSEDVLLSLEDTASLLKKHRLL